MHDICPHSILRGLLRGPDGAHAQVHDQTDAQVQDRNNAQQGMKVQIAALQATAAAYKAKAKKAAKELKELKAKMAAIKSVVPAKQLASLMTAAVMTRCPGESPASVLAHQDRCAAILEAEGNAGPVKQLVGERGGYGSYGGSSGGGYGSKNSKAAAKGAKDSGAIARCELCPSSKW